MIIRYAYFIYVDFYNSLVSGSDKGRVIADAWFDTTIKFSRVADAEYWAHQIDTDRWILTVRMRCYLSTHLSSSTLYVNMQAGFDK